MNSWILQHEYRYEYQCLHISKMSLALRQEANSERSNEIEKLRNDLKVNNCLEGTEADLDSQRSWGLQKLEWPSREIVSWEKVWVLISLQWPAMGWGLPLAEMRWPWAGQEPCYSWVLFLERADSWNLSVGNLLRIEGVKSFGLKRDPSVPNSIPYIARIHLLPINYVSDSFRILLDFFSWEEMMREWLMKQPLWMKQPLLLLLLARLQLRLISLLSCLF